LVTSSLLASARVSDFRLFQNYFQTWKEHPPLSIRIVMFMLILAAGHRGYAQQAMQTLDQHLRPAITSGQATVVGALPGDRQLSFSLVLPLQKE